MHVRDPLLKVLLLATHRGDKVSLGVRERLVGQGGSNLSLKLRERVGLRNARAKLRAEETPYHQINVRGQRVQPERVSLNVGNLLRQTEAPQLLRYKATMNRRRQRQVYTAKRLTCGPQEDVLDVDGRQVRDLLQLIMRRQLARCGPQSEYVRLDTRCHSH
jgi:hypothetical protein